MLLELSVTESLANFATHLINHAGYAGIAILTFISSLVILPGTEVTMLFGGFSVDQGHLTLLGLVAVASVVDIFGAICVYWIAYFGVVELLRRLPGPFNVSAHGTERAEIWFERWGMAAVALTRILPTVRAGGPWAAGIAKMPFGRYVVAMAAGTVVWMFGLAEVGKAVGKQWPKWKAHLDYVDYAAVVLVVALVGWFLYARVYKPRMAARAGIDI